MCRETSLVAPTLSELELKWGDYAPGRYAYRLENVRVLSEPVFARGSLGFWPVNAECEHKIAEHLMELRRGGRDAKPTSSPTL